jgi:DnaJ-class molecular chaperone
VTVELVEKLKLERTCSTCGGSGMKQKTDALGFSPERCKDCDGLGSFLEPDGVKILTFLKRHWEAWKSR